MVVVVVKTVVAAVVIVPPVMAVVEAPMVVVRRSWPWSRRCWLVVAPTVDSLSVVAVVLLTPNPVLIR